jgi:uncharacterized repeat protein (TIGR03803 family)
MRLSKAGLLCIVFSLLALAMMSVTDRSQAFALGNESVLFNFNAGGTGDTGYFPHSTLILDSDGNLYGTTPNGGTHGEGTVFELSPPATSGGMWTETILWNFDNNGTDGYIPWTWGPGLVLDSHGNLYGTTQAGGAYDEGTAWELSPPATSGGMWTETIIWNFGDPLTTDGIVPTSGLTMDKNGNLYGTTLEGQTASGGGLDGTVFELSPPSSLMPGTWTESILMQFAQGGNPDRSVNGFFPYAGVIGDGSGNLYGTTSDGGTNATGTDPGGTLFELSTSGGYAVLWNFGGTFGPDSVYDGADPVSGLLMDKQGNLYGTTNLGGTTADFLISGDNGVGTVFELSPPGSGGGSWTESVLYNFLGGAADGESPVAGVVMDKRGNLYGTTEYGGPYTDEPYLGGTAYQLTPPPVSTGNWAETILWNFGNGADGSLPWAATVMDPSGNLYGSTLGGGSFGNDNGTVYEIAASPTPTATATVTSTPTATATPISEKLTIHPVSLAFGHQTKVGTTSNPRTVTIKNDGRKKKGLAVSIETESASPSVFAVKSQCAATLEPTRSCKVSVTFQPTDTSEQTGKLMIFDDVTGSPQSVALSGAGKTAKKKK